MHKQPRRLGLIALLSLAIVAAGLAHARPIVYPRAFHGEADRPTRYALAVLQLALREVGSNDTLEPSRNEMLQDRALRELGARNGTVDIVWTMTSIPRERRFLPIRIPLFKGLFGWRVALVRDDDADALAHITTLGELQHLTAGQGHDWPDTTILRANGLPVVEGTAYESLFRMLAGGRFEYFPRSVLEASDEAASHTAQHLIVDGHLLLHYATACYFFVNRDNGALADLVNHGLELAIADGSFDKLFQATFGDLLAPLQLQSRTLIDLHNPLLPPDTPLSRTALWMTPMVAVVAAPAKTRHTRR